VSDKIFEDAEGEEELEDGAGIARVAQVDNAHRDPILKGKSFRLLL